MISKIAAKALSSITRLILARTPARINLQLLSFLILASLLLSGCARTGNLTTAAAPAESVQMIMQDAGYQPENLKIELSQTVTFKNNSQQDKWPASNIHPTHGIYPQFDPQKAVKPGENWSFTFERKGIFPYHDHLNPNITGIIEVE